MVLRQTRLTNLHDPTNRREEKSSERRDPLTGPTTVVIPTRVWENDSEFGEDETDRRKDLGVGCPRPRRSCQRSGKEVLACTKVRFSSSVSVGTSLPFLFPNKFPRVSIRRR